MWHFTSTSIPQHFWKTPLLPQDFSSSQNFSRLCTVPPFQKNLSCALQNSGSEVHKKSVLNPTSTMKQMHYWIFFLSTEPWTYAHSRSAKQLYFYNKDTHESTYEIPRDSVASFKSSLGTRYYWPWEDVDLSHDEGPRMERNNLIEFFTAAQNEFIHGPPRK